MHFILISGDPTDESWLRMWPVCREIVPHADYISDVQIYSLASKGYLQGNKKGSKSENSSETCTQHLKGFGPLMNCWQCCHCSLCESHQKKWRKEKKTKTTLRPKQKMLCLGLMNRKWKEFISTSASALCASSIPETDQNGSYLRNI